MSVVMSEWKNFSLKPADFWPLARRPWNWDAARLKVVSEQLEDIGLAGVKMPLAVPIPTNPAVAVAVVVDAGDEPVMVGASGHIGRHWPQNSDRACLQGASLTLAEAERGGRARDCCPGWVCHHPNLRRRCGQEQRETPRQPRCSTRVRRGAKPSTSHIPRNRHRYRRITVARKPGHLPASVSRHSKVRTFAPRSINHMHDPDALSPRMFRQPMLTRPHLQLSSVGHPMARTRSGAPGLPLRQPAGTIHSAITTPNVKSEPQFTAWIAGSSPVFSVGSSVGRFHAR